MRLCERFRIAPTDWGAAPCTCSAKDATNVEQSFFMAAQAAIARIPAEPNPLDLPAYGQSGVDLAKKPSGNGCCS